YCDSSLHDSLSLHDALPISARQGMAMLTGLSDSMRGALLVCGETGKRLDNTGARGIRVSRMDIAEEAGFTAWLDSNNLNNIHIRDRKSTRLNSSHVKISYAV